MTLETILETAMGAAVATPALAFLALGVLWLLDRAPGERATARIVTSALAVSCLLYTSDAADD